MNRRDFMRTAGGASVAAGATVGAAGPAAAAEAEGGDDSGGGGGQQVPDFGSYLDDANLFDGSNVQDVRGEDSVTIAVGGGDGLAFDPPTVWVSPGATITWEWTGEGGAHNVVNEDGPAALDSGDAVADEGHTYEYEVTEEDAGITLYKCVPHEGQGMKGGVAVGDDVETIEVGGGGDEGPTVEIPDQALALTVATLIAMGTTLGLGYFLMKFGGDYEQ